MLVPHLGEYDQEALVSRSLTYEPGCCSWIEQNAASFDAIIEIGANVGLYTALFDYAGRATGSRVKAIFAFEPSKVAYNRLLKNLDANKAKFVTALPCAIADANRFTSFYEPQDHLTNGSLLRDFAEIFSDKMRESLVLSINASVLEGIFSRYERILLKIDVEGSEPVVLQSLSELICEHRPHILIEILDRTEAALREALSSNAYSLFLVTDDCLVRYDRVFASPQFRDWLLVPNGAACSEPAPKFR